MQPGPTTPTLWGAPVAPAPIPETAELDRHHSLVANNGEPRRVKDAVMKSRGEILTCYRGWLRASPSSTMRNATNEKQVAEAIEEH